MQNTDRNQAWKYSPVFLLVCGIAVVLFGYLFYGVMRSLEGTWASKEEYSHGYFIPVISAYLIYQKRELLRRVPFTGSWFGVFLLALGGFLLIGGRLAVVSTMGQYAFVICIWGFCLSILGWRAFKIIWPAIFMLIFMVKLPTFLYNNLSSELQLISNKLGVLFIELFGISVYYEGNVIDLGLMKLQVVEACNGLRYLFPLMALSMILAILYKGSFWRKALIFLSSMPISIFMNSIRIGAIGVTVEYWGKEMAEGVLHDFEGWIVFMAALGLVLVEIKLLSMIVGDKRPLSEVLSLDAPEVEAKADDEKQIERKIPNTLFVSIGIIGLVLLTNISLNVAETVFPTRTKLSHFPMIIDGWQAKPSVIESQFLDELQLDDYFLADYQAPFNESPINFYIAYYDVQAEGEGTIHSPRSCLPGAGWQIKSLTHTEIQNTQAHGEPLKVRRALIAKADSQLLVYYWLQGRGRIITNEFMAKWWIFWDRMNLGRSDGALVRVMVDVSAFENLQQAESDLQSFVQRVYPMLPEYIPD